MILQLTDIELLAVGLDTVWVLLASFLVFFMQAGFAFLEAGFIRSKNTVNVLMKNFVDFIVASLVYFIFGYAFMFGLGNGFIGTTGFFLINAENPSGVPLFSFVLFQTVFAGAAATIVSGAMAERTQFRAYLVYTFVISAFVYPIVGHWIWGGGWLYELGFGDFAGSTVVHMVGGLCALIGASFLGSRLGKFNKDKSANIIAGHNIPFAALGTLILWIGWFGFNPGSTLGVGDGEAIALVSLNTNLAAVAGGLSAMIVVWVRFGKPDISMVMNGVLAGLVAITAPCAFVTPIDSIIIGLIAGVIIAFGVLFIDKLGIDDPVGAVSVHFMNGIWGTVAVGLFGQSTYGLARDGLFYGGGVTQLGVQLLGIGTVAVFVSIIMIIMFGILKKFNMLRVSRKEELRGLDIDEHGMEAYPEYQIFLNR
jgi:Amt family ammonium transporter